MLSDKETNIDAKMRAVGKTVIAIVPAHNEEKTIRKCLLSLINQNYKISEIIVVLDRCTDNTDIIVEELAEKHSEVKAVKKTVTKYSKIWKGHRYCEVLNWGLQNITKEPDYLFIIDADTVISSKYLAKAIKIFNKNPNCALVGARGRKSIRGSGSVYKYSVFKKLIGPNFVECESPDSYVLITLRAAGYDTAKLERTEFKFLREAGGKSFKDKLLDAFRRGFSGYRMGYTPPYAIWSAINDVKNPFLATIWLVSYVICMLTGQKKYKPAMWLQSYQKTRLKNMI